MCLWCWRRLLRVSWTARRSNQSIPNEISPEYLFGRTDAEAETPILWLPNVKNWLIGKDPDAEKDWRQKEKEMTKDEVVGWHHWLDGHEFEQAPGVDVGQGSLACYSPWWHKESDTTEWLNWTEQNISHRITRNLSYKDLKFGNMFRGIKYMVGSIFLLPKNVSLFP